MRGTVESVLEALAVEIAVAMGAVEDCLDAFFRVFADKKRPLGQWMVLAPTVSIGGSARSESLLMPTHHP